MKMLCFAISLSLCTIANAHNAVKSDGDCYLTQRPNVAICINNRTLQPCTVINDTNAEHVKHRRAREQMNQVFLVGSNMPIGDLNGTYNISTYDGLTWFAGECK